MKDCKYCAFDGVEHDHSPVAHAENGDPNYSDDETLAEIEARMEGYSE